jgi:hypothetical protein
MRRALLLATALVFLTCLGLGWARISTTHAYNARDRFARIQVGMTRQEVRELMANISAPDAREVPPLGDLWMIGVNYWIMVDYEVDTAKRTRVVAKHLDQAFERSFVDDLLECVGLPKSTVFRF